MKKNRIKKFIICLMFLFISSAAFADTLYVVKGGLTFTNIKTYKNMKMSRSLTAASMKNNEYMLVDYGLYYKVDGELYLTSMFDIKFD